MQRYLALVVVLIAISATSVQGADPLFASDELLDITLSGPFARIDKERDKEAEYAGSLSYVDRDGQAVTLDAKFSVRGNFRLQKDVCSHAQLWVNLRKKQVKDTLFAKQDKLKLVVQCRESDRYREYLAREQQVYSMFQQLSELSLATRLLNVTFQDSEKDESRTDLGFFIEHQRRLAKQHDMSVLDTPGADRERLDPAHSATVALFMYLVSNTDYSMIAAPPGENCCHNIKVLESADGKLYPIPYDFDSTGFVSTKYAEPSGGLGQRNVRQRMYRGYCLPEAATASARTLLQDRRNKIYAIIADDRYVASRAIKTGRKYVDKFYEIIDDDRKYQREILDDCR